MASTFDDEETRPPNESTPSAFRLLAIGRAGVVPVALPASGTFVVGRARDSDLQLSDQQVSRHHLRFHLGAEVQVEDLGSRNGARCHGRRLLKGERVRIELGDVVQVGLCQLVLQHPNDGARPTVLEPLGQSPEMQALDQLVGRIAPSLISVLILGETGAGKDVIAQRIHDQSSRAAQQLLRINCGALTENLLESELFGHERGAFTGADKAKPGLLESAQGGTVLLDEIGELPLHLQVKLLEVLETRQVMRVGGLRARRIDVRFLSATNRDLRQEAARGNFRQDLLFRIEGVVVRVPPLREHTSDILPLARSFIAEAAHGVSKSPPLLTPEAERHIMSHAWPGNVRELRNAIARAVLLCGDRIEPEHLSSRQLDATTGSADAKEKQRIIAALEQCAGNQTRAARLLGIARSTLVLRLDAFGIPRPRC